MKAAEEKTRLRVATYNVHGCVGRGGVHPERVADVVASLQCDVIGLQEIDVHRPRSGAVDQLTMIARRLGYEAIFGPAWECDVSGAYGNAILSRWPILESCTHALPERSGRRCEPRSLLEATLQSPAGEVTVWNTHLGVRGFERAAQGEALLERARGAIVPGGPPLVLLGDLNARPQAAFVRAFSPLLADARGRASGRVATYPAWWPLLALDHVLVSDPLKVVDVRAERSALAAVASDHLPLSATLEWSARPVSSAASARGLDSATATDAPAAATDAPAAATRQSS